MAEFEHMAGSPHDDNHEECSVASTAGGSLGHTESDMESCVPVYVREGDASDRTPCASEKGYASVFLNGVQLIRCTLPVAGAGEAVSVSAEDLNVTGEVGGVSLGAMFTATQDPVEGHEWHAALHCATAGITTAAVAVPGKRRKRKLPPPIALDLGVLASSKDTAHYSHFLKHTPTTFTLHVTQLVKEEGARPAPAEQLLVKEVRAVLESSQQNRGQGSLGAVLLNNRAKESVLYDTVVSSTYAGSWQDFLKAHPKDFTLFHYSEKEIVANGFSPQIKRSDMRVCLVGVSSKEIAKRDKARCQRQREDEEELQAAVTRMLSEKSVSQRELLAMLREVPSFTDTLYPVPSLMMRYLARHSSLFVTTSGPDQPTRIGLAAQQRRLPKTVSTDFMSQTQLDVLESSSNSSNPSTPSDSPCVPNGAVAPAAPGTGFSAVPAKAEGVDAKLATPAAASSTRKKSKRASKEPKEGDKASAAKGDCAKGAAESVAAVPVAGGVRVSGAGVGVGVALAHQGVQMPVELVQQTVYRHDPYATTGPYVYNVGC
eukprot:TRINITY_DN28711_c0_g1_i1.p1 TRINITY_DN28711_c0_g1~~TRINITY_DN28711_c0_g1_i1.p1  ORF type:complete len:543 (+),score=160.59 TRINITY_DN28711_c0_g1_i1:283-1911(+)